MKAIGFFLNIMMSQNDVGSSVPRPTQPPAQPQGDFYEATAQPNIVASSRLIDTSRSYSGSDDVSDETS